MSKNDRTILQRFGRYLLLDHLVDGGMAKICRARFLGEQADKVVAIKMIQPQFSRDEAFKNMFLDEIKVTFGLNHPNVCQTYDCGFENDQLFTAMEFVDGQNLKQFLDKLKSRNFVFPVEISVHIASQACQGLHYAHTFTDKLTGKKTNIVHRDISPHNIMITYDGAVKIIDFGIAKAESNSDATQAGTIKGKLSYLAPEYLEGLALDARYDQFALGITLWEMLCSRKLFKASNDLAVLKEIQACKIPAPSSINPNVPKELDQIVLKALSKDRKLRFENLDQMNRVLVKFLYTNYPDFNATDLSYFAKELFKEDIKIDREKLFEFGKIDIKPYIEEMRNDNGSSNQTVKDDAPVIKKAAILDFGFDDNNESEDSASDADPITNQSLAKKSRATRVKARANIEESKTRSVSISAKSIQSENSGTQVGTMGSINNPNATTIKKVQKVDNKRKYTIAAAVIFLALVGYLKFTKYSTKPEESRVPSSVTSETTSSGTGILSLVNKSIDKQIFINGSNVQLSVFGDIELENGNYTLRVETKGRKHFIKRFTITSEEPVKIKLPNLKETDFVPYGYLHTSKSCIRGKLFFELFREHREENLPIVSSNNIGIALPLGDYDMEYQKKGEDFKRPIRVSIPEENMLVDLCKQDL